MKKCTLLIICIAFLLPLKSYSSYIEDSTAIKHELSVSLDKGSTFNLGLNYARRVSPKYWLRFGANYWINYANYIPVVAISYPIVTISSLSTFLIGLERHRAIKSNFEYISGFDLRVMANLNYQRVDNPMLPIGMQRTSTLELSYGLGATFGLYYKISDNFLIGSSLNPIITYGKRSTDYTISHFVGFTLTNFSILSLRYRF